MSASSPAIQRTKPNTARNKIPVCMSFEKRSVGRRVSRGNDPIIQLRKALLRAYLESRLNDKKKNQSIRIYTIHTYTHTYRESEEKSGRIIVFFLVAADARGIRPAGYRAVSTFFFFFSTFIDTRELYAVPVQTLRDSLSRKPLVILCARARAVKVFNDTASCAKVHKTRP